MISAIALPIAIARFSYRFHIINTDALEGSARIVVSPSPALTPGLMGHARIYIYTLFVGIYGVYIVYFFFLI